MLKFASVPAWRTVGYTLGLGSLAGCLIQLTYLLLDGKPASVSSSISAVTMPLAIGLGAALGGWAGVETGMLGRRLRWTLALILLLLRLFVGRMAFQVYGAAVLLCLHAAMEITMLSLVLADVGRRRGSAAVCIAAMMLHPLWCGLGTPDLWHPTGSVLGYMGFLARQAEGETLWVLYAGFPGMILGIAACFPIALGTTLQATDRVLGNQSV